MLPFFDTAGARSFLQDGPKRSARSAWLVVPLIATTVSTARAQGAPGAPAGTQNARATYGDTDETGLRRARFLDHAVPAPKHALEIGFNFGYRQGIGALGGGATLNSVAGAGVSAELGLGFRASPRWLVGAYAVGAQYRTGSVLDEGAARSLTLGAQVALHFRPERAMDPWLALGAGYQSLWLSPRDAGTVRAQAIEPLRVQLGIDYRIVPELAVGPYAGAEVLIALNAPELPGIAPNAGGGAVSTYFGAGLQVRIDTMGVAVAPAPAQSAIAGGRSPQASLAAH